MRKPVSHLCPLPCSPSPLPPVQQARARVGEGPRNISTKAPPVRLSWKQGIEGYSVSSAGVRGEGGKWGLTLSEGSIRAGRGGR